jgi:hypothetical protein
VILAHLGGLPIQESLIYLVPPIAVVVWIWVLGRRQRDDPEPPEATDGEEDEAAVAPSAGRADRTA